MPPEYQIHFQQLLILRRYGKRLPQVSAKFKVTMPALVYPTTLHFVQHPLLCSLDMIHDYYDLVLLKWIEMDFYIFKLTERFKHNAGKVIFNSFKVLLERWQ